LATLKKVKCQKRSGLKTIKMTWKKENWIYLVVIFVTIYSCKNNEYPQPKPIETDDIHVYTDKANYKPGDIVSFSTDKILPSGSQIRYKFLGNTIREESISGQSWTWSAPAGDYKGYLAELYYNEGEEEKMLATIAIDVSSDWSRFPRYGFLSDYGNISDASIESIISNLNRHHINGLQFYDWQYKHHLPLAGTPANPEATWTDIINKDVYFTTLSKYIELSHQHNMKAMFYNLAFGALNDASYDGVAEEWYIYSDKNHSNKDMHPLPQPPFKSDIYLTDPANVNWQNYINDKHNDVYAALDFDGFHVDQLGDRGTKYDYWGNEVNLPDGYFSFISAAKSAAENKSLVMNAVNQFGQAQIASAETDFLYTEVWGPNESYSDLANILLENNSFSANSKNTILAAYMNYDLANNTGTFNTPAVLMTNAVIFAFGGAHLELGEHMLGKEYFPNNNLEMKPDLRAAMIRYYDFLVAYQNLLRDGGDFNSPTVRSTDGKVSLNSWPPEVGKVSTIGKEIDGKQVIHFVNFSDAIHLAWRDNSGSQPYPNIVYDYSVSVSGAQSVSKVWFASPDYNGGASTDITFNENNGSISFELPLLEYWSMVVLEFQ
jgi:dextranase